MAEQSIRSLAIALAAGAAGTAAMTLSQALEQRMLNKRRPKTAASVAENVTGIEADTEEGRAETSSTLHWLYGTGLGAALVPLEGVSEPYRSLTFLGGVYGAGLAWESIADRQDAPSKRSATDMGADFVHHLVYAGTATLAYNGLKSAFFSGDDSYDDTGGYSTGGNTSRSGTSSTSTSGTGTTGTGTSGSTGSSGSTGGTTTSSNNKTERANA
ncbi:MAG TPA: hypothetical protein VEZ41_01770 [Allosphingosinicella sp.]|jgi:hypothetical protein|nr:hypothetical protein [Allosphingosinicella sp.]